jgi:hypothetical protein
MNRHVVVTLLLLGLALCTFASEKPVSRQEYLSYMTTAAENGWNNLQAGREAWRKTIDPKYIFGYNPPWDDCYLAALYSNLYEITKDERCLDRTKALLLYYGRYREAYPPGYAESRPEFAKGGVPALPNIFTFGKYVHAYRVLKAHRSLTRAERDTIEQNIAGSADYTIGSQEWGPMNRALLRAEAVGYAAKVLPNHPHHDTWEMYAKILGDDSWKRWEIEDATGYHAVWFYSLLAYASDIREDESLYRSPIMHYYFEYMLSLMSPAGFIPDFGDADWKGGWERFIPFFEKGGSTYKDPRYRWAAATIFRQFLSPQPEKTSVAVGVALSDAYRWADFSVGSDMPATASQEVIDDVVGKKVVFRNGWNPASTYMLYTYRDIGDGGWLPREYLRTSIPVEEEKMTHGHSDENSISLLMKNGSVLLHDGGYRDFMPSGAYGSYRADFYHNRLVVRDGKIALGQKEGEYRYSSPNHAAVPGQSLLDFFRNSGAYRDVRTSEIDFQTTRYADMTRTRLTDEHLGYEADRTIVYLKEVDWFVVIDALRFTKPGYLTMAPLWHTRQVLETGPGWYDTAYDSLRQNDVRGNQNLLVYFPQRAQLADGVVDQRRYYQNEKTIYQMIGRHGYRNTIQTFVTVLIPHGKDVKPNSLLEGVHMMTTERPDEATALSIDAGGRKYLIGLKVDLESELVRDWRRPMYLYDAGKTTYGDFVTDGQFFITREDQDSVWYSVSGATKLSHKGAVLIEQPSTLAYLSFDGTPDAPGVGKLRRWEAAVKK